MSTTHTPIEWTDRTWNPTRGCSRISPGCKFCYAERIAARFRNSSFKGYVQITNGHPQWTGKVDLLEDKLTEPLSWRKPARVFVNSMSDLFHEGFADDQIDCVFAVMALCPQHTFQILTKRADRMRRYFEDIGYRAEVIGIRAEFISGLSRWKDDLSPTWPLPLPNVWLGVSAEDQQRADERIPELLRTPAAVRFVSYEPALGPVDFSTLPSASGIGRFLDALSNSGVDPGAVVPERLDWIIVGGESGQGARPFSIEWARDVVSQCSDAGVACFVKQLGAQPLQPRDGDTPIHMMLKDRKGGDMSEWPEDLQVREYPVRRA